MNDQQTLVDAAYIKLRNGEPMSPDDFQRTVSLFTSSPWALAPVATEVRLGLYANFLEGLQQLQANITKATQEMSGAQQ